MASMSRMILMAMGMCILALLAGCVMHETYADRATPESDLAVVQGYWHYRFLYDEELHIASVDGRRESGRSGWPYAYSVSIPPGKHWLQLMVLRNSVPITTCAFEWTFEARHRYKLDHLGHDQLLLAHPASPHFAASISMVVSTPTKPDQNVSAPAVCGQGPMCRQNSDCPSQYSCQRDTNFEFGTCKSRDR